MAEKIQIIVSRRINFDGKEIEKTAQAEITEEQAQNDGFVDTIIRGLFSGITPTEEQKQ